MTQDLLSKFNVKHWNRYDNIYNEDASATEQYSEFMEGSKDTASASLLLVSKK